MLESVAGKVSSCGWVVFEDILPFIPARSEKTEQEGNCKVLSSILTFSKALKNTLTHHTVPCHGIRNAPALLLVCSVPPTYVDSLLATDLVELSEGVGAPLKPSSALSRPDQTFTFTPMCDPTLSGGGVDPQWETGFHFLLLSLP